MTNLEAVEAAIAAGNHDEAMKIAEDILDASGDQMIAAGMAADAAAQAARAVLPKRGEIPTPVITIDNVWGQVAIFGGENISPAMLNMVVCAITAWDEWNLGIEESPSHHGVHSIVFRTDGKPLDVNDVKPIHAHCQPTMGAMAINLEHIFNEALDETFQRPQISLYCNIWHLTMLAVLHEMDHLYLSYEDPTATVIDGCKKADEFSDSYSMFLAQNYNIEPGPLADEPYFSKKVMEVFQIFADGADEDEIFLKDQQMKALQGIMFWPETDEDEQPIVLKSFRQYMHWVSKAEKDDPKWAKLYEKQPSEAEVRESINAALVASQPTPAQPAPAVAVIQPAPAVPNETVEINAYTGVETEVFDVDPYLDAMMDMDAPPWDEDDTPVVAAPVAAAPAVAPPVAAVNPLAPAPAPTLMPNSSGMAHGLSAAEVGQVCMTVYRRLFNHLFTQCGQIKIDNTTVRPDGQGGGCGGFNNMAAVQQPIPISDIPNANKVFVQMDAKIGGRWSKGVAIRDSIIGSDTGNKTMLPKYDVYIINHEGHMEKRTLLPQNPWKINPEGTAFTKPAVEAQNGKQIMYIYSENVMKCKLLAENGREWVEDANWNVIG